MRIKDPESSSPTAWRRCQFYEVKDDTNMLRWSLWRVGDIVIALYNQEGKRVFWNPRTDSCVRRKDAPPLEKIEPGTYTVELP